MTKFDLIGNSLGGLLCSLYSIKHPEKINKLFLTSPAGISDTMLTKEDIKNRLKNVNFLKRWGYSFFKKKVNLICYY